MKATFVACVLLIGVTCGVLAQDQEPVRLQRKPKPPQEKKDDEKKPEDKKAEPAKPKVEKKTEPAEETEIKGKVEPNPVDQEKELREIANRIAKNMKGVEELLGKNDASDGTQQLQRAILTDLDALIEQTQRQQDQQQQQQAQQQSSPSSSKNQQRTQQQQQRSARRQQQQRQQQTARQQPQPQPKEEPGKEPQETQVGRGKNGKEMNRIADLYKDIWGHLPQTLRQEMDQYAREEFMSKYGDLLKQYYATLAEKGRRNAATPER